MSALGCALFIYLLNYFYFYLSKLFTVEENSSYCMSKTKNKYIITNLHLLNSQVDSGINQPSRIELSSKSRQRLKAVICFCIRHQPRYPAELNASLMGTLKNTKYRK